MEWMTLTSTVIGATLALIATVVAHSLGSRERRRRDSRANARRSYLDFALGAEAAHAGLRRLAEPGPPSPDRALQARRAVSESGLYAAREELLLVGSAPINAAAEQVLVRLGALRRAIGNGAALSTRAYHDAYHPLATALWELRRAARAEFGYQPLRPADVGKISWDSQESCSFCASEQEHQPPPQQHQPVGQADSAP